MPKRNNSQEAAIQAVLAGYQRARELGRDYHREFPELKLVEVARHAATTFEDKNHQIAFLQGYSQARSDRDSYQRGE